MSKIGKIPIEIKNNVSVSIDKQTITVRGTKGSSTFAMPEGIRAEVGENKIIVSPKREIDSKSSNKLEAMFGLTRAMIANMVKGVTEGFEKKLSLTGVGYRASVSGNDLVLSVGFSHSVKITATATEGIKFSVAENVITVSGTNKALVGDFADRIKRVRPPDPYKGKGISYVGERLRKKAGKAKTIGVK